MPKKKRVEDDKISTLNGQIMYKLEERLMNEVVTILMDYNALKERVEKLEGKAIEERKEERHEDAMKTAKASFWIALTVGALQIGLILYQIFWK